MSSSSKNMNCWLDLTTGLRSGQTQAMKVNGRPLKNSSSLKVLSKIKKDTSTLKSLGSSSTNFLTSSISFLYWYLIDYFTFSYSDNGKLYSLYTLFSISIFSYNLAFSWSYVESKFVSSLVPAANAVTPRTIIIMQNIFSTLLHPLISP